MATRRARVASFEHAAPELHAELHSELCRELCGEGSEALTLARFPDGPSEEERARAWHAEARVDLGEIERLRAPILQAAREVGVDPALLAAIVSRESRAGRILSEDGTGESGHGYGLMQIDESRFHEWLSGHDWRDPFINLHKGAEILVALRDEVEQRARDQGLAPTAGQVLAWTVSAYNCGAAGAVWGVVDHRSADHYTTGRDYAADVLARAQYFRARGYRMPA